MPIVGSFAGASSRAYGLQAGIIVGDFESIETVTVGAGGVTSITFSSIPQTYTHLQIRYIARTGGTSGNMVIQFNGDTASNYSTHYLSGNGSSTVSGAEANVGRIYTDVLTSSATSYSGCVVDILDYANTNKYKTTRSLAGIDLNGSGTAWLASGNWRSTSAITSILLKEQSSGNIAQYSSFALYGIKG